MPVVPSKAIVPAPPKVSLANDRTSAFEPVRWIVPLSVRPPLTRNAEFVPDTVRSLLSVTPLVNVPLVLSVLKSSVEPFANCTVPPLITPKKFHDPVAAFNVSVEPVLVSVPLRLTVPPVRLIAPNPAVVKVPPRLRVEFVTVMVPVLVQLLPRFSVESVAVIVPVLPVARLFTANVAPLVACAVPVLTNVLLGEIVTVMPETLVEMRPAFTRKLPPPCSTCPPIDPEYPPEIVNVEARVSVEAPSIVT